MPMNAGFQQFWQVYPRRVGKLAALKEWQKAVRLDSVENILAGVERYKRTKPEYADWCHPRTFLSQGRWMDEVDEAPASQPAEDWYAECQRVHGGACGLSRFRHHLAMQKAQSA